MNDLFLPPGSPLRTAKEVLQKAKALQKMDSVLKEEANKNAYQTFAAGVSAKSNESKKATEEKKVENQAGTQRFEVTGDNPNPWSTEEQQLLEQALKTYPASLGAERYSTRFLNLAWIWFDRFSMDSFFIHANSSLLGGRRYRNASHHDRKRNV